jgi:hypothetical protein
VTTSLGQSDIPDSNNRVLWTNRWWPPSLVHESGQLNVIWGLTARSIRCSIQGQSEHYIQCLQSFDWTILF